MESEKETSSEEENNKNQDEPCCSKTTKVEEMPTQSLVAKPEKVAKQKESKKDPSKRQYLESNLTEGEELPSDMALM